MKIKIFTLLGIIYFFFNATGLPFGLTYITLLSPFIFLKVFFRYIKFFLFFLIFLIIYFFIHYSYGIESYPDYFVSCALHASIAIQAVGFYHILKNKPDLVFKTVERLGLLNIIAMIIALFFITSTVSNIFWREYNLTDIPQLRLLTYEPSYYSLLLVPIFFYFLDKRLRGSTTKTNIILTGTIIALLFSRSLGVVAGIVLSVFFYYFRLEFLLRVKYFKVFMIIGLAGFFFSLFLIVFFPENVFVVRISNFIQGKDISGSARVFEPWMLGYQILEQKSYIFGIGWGHIKILGHEIISDYYNYPPALNKRVTIPNSLAEIFIILGFVGLIFKLALEIYLYKVTRVKNSRFRYLIFLFIFIYQFTGSYSSSLAECILWILAFTSTNNLQDLRKNKQIKFG